MSMPQPIVENLTDNLVRPRGTDPLSTIVLCEWKSTDDEALSQDAARTGTGRFRRRRRRVFGTASNGMGGNGVYSYYNSVPTPLFGGSRGGGSMGATAGGNGGAGAAALRIVSSTLIEIDGIISALGGPGTGFSGAAVYYSGLYNPPTTVPGLPAVHVVSVNGVAAPSFPGGSATVPDIVINAPKPVTVAISAQYIPVGTVVQSVYHLPVRSRFNGCLRATGWDPASSTAKCSGVTFPGGVAITEIRAMW